MSEQVQDTFERNFNENNVASENNWSELLRGIYGNNSQKDKNQEPIVMPDKPKLDLSDLLNKFNKDKNKDGEEQIEKVAPLSKNEIADYARRISEIIARGGDFSYGGKNEKIRDMFGHAAKAGQESFDNLLAALNKQLEGMGLKLKGQYSLDTTKDLIDHGDIVLTSYPPIYPNARFKHTTTARVDLSLQSKQGEEDSLRVDRVVSQSIKRESYRPQLEEKERKSLLKFLGND